MSTSSTQSRRRILQDGDKLDRSMSRGRPKTVGYNDAYTFALRAAYLHHLLQPRLKRKQYIQNPKSITRSSTSSITDLVKDFALLKDTKSAKLPHGFMSPMEKRIQGVVIGTERLPGYNDAAVKRTFAEAYTAFSETGFRRRMDKERRVEDLVLIFYSNATKALQKGKTADDDSWRNMVDRHVALFVRLLSNTLKDHGNDKDRPELMGRLATLEKKLLTDDQDLSVGVGPKDTYIEVVTPLSYDVKDMPMVQVVAQIFGLKHSQVQSDIDTNRSLWTEEAALADLKSYQHCLGTNSNRTLRSEDFDLDEAYQAWKKSEGPELSQLILDILHVKPELAKGSSGINKGPGPATQQPADTPKLTSPVDSSPPYGFDQPIDLSNLTLQDTASLRLYNEQSTYTFIPPDPRSYYRCILMHAAMFDQLHTGQSAMDDTVTVSPLLSKQSLELLDELSTRWRIPYSSRLVLFLDVTAQRFMDQEIGLEELNMAFESLKSPRVEAKRGAHNQSVDLSNLDQTLLTVRDFALYRQSLSILHDALLRDLYDILQHCYETKPPSIGPIMVILESHIYNDAMFSRSSEQLKEYTTELERGLREQAASVYREYLEAEVPHAQEEWQFFHVVQLGKAVVKLCQRIQKRYKKSPEVMGVNPLTILVETMFPSFENDANELIQRILHVAKENGSEVDLQDGFDLYKELVEIRRIHRDALPDVPFTFHIEGLLADFVWRWIRVASDRMIELVNTAISQDKFQVRSDNPSDEDRHSVSIIDLFRLFNETNDQVFQLDWDDDVHHAQFMTALSKSFGVGLARYCEVIEQDFTAEMNRPSPAQEVAATQTKQEKWMQLAKDAWNNKERIEPFQFYPQVSHCTRSKLFRQHI